MSVSAQTIRNRWRREEVSLLGELLDSGSQIYLIKKKLDELCDRNNWPRRTENAIDKKLRKNGKQSHLGWSQEEERLLKELYNGRNIHLLARQFNRTESSINNKLKRLGLKHAKTSTPWEMEELQILKKVAKERGFIEAVKADLDDWAAKNRKSQRSLQAIYAKASGMGISFAAAKDDKNLLTPNEISQMLGCCPNTVLDWLKNEEMARILSPKGRGVREKNASHYITRTSLKRFVATYRWHICNLKNLDVFGLLSLLLD